LTQTYCADKKISAVLIFAVTLVIHAIYSIATWLHVEILNEHSTEKKDRKTREKEEKIIEK